MAEEEERGGEGVQGEPEHELGEVGEAVNGLHPPPAPVPSEIVLSQ